MCSGFCISPIWRRPFLETLNTRKQANRVTVPSSIQFFNYAALSLVVTSIWRQQGNWMFTFQEPLYSCYIAFPLSFLQLSQTARGSPWLLHTWLKTCFKMLSDSSVTFLLLFCQKTQKITESLVALVRNKLLDQKTILINQWSQYLRLLLHEKY